MANKFIKRAINPQQYDFNDVFWDDKEIGLSSPTRKWFWQYLQKFSPLWRDKDILDIGCGTGWFMELLRLQDIRSIEGFDPSQKSIQTAHRLFPSVKAQQDDFASFVPQKKYDLIFSIMSFGHIDDVEKSFQKLSLWLKQDGGFILAVPNYDYFRKKRYDYIVEIEDMNSDEYVVNIKRPHWGVIAEIARKTSVYKIAAQKAGFVLKEELPMKPTDTLIIESPRYKESQDEVLSDLLYFKKEA